MKDEQQMFSMRIEKATIRKMRAESKREKRTLSSMIRIVLIEWLDRRSREAKENAA